VSMLASRSHAAWSTAVLFAAAGVAWVVTVERMQGMDAGPGTDLGGLGWYLGVWATMSAAMMLPSAVAIGAAIARESRGTPLSFSVGYLAVWCAFGLAAYGLFRLVTFFDTGWLDWDGNGPYVVGGAIVAAGVYELTPAKQHCLGRCRLPLNAAGSDGDRLRALRIGVSHGLYCVGCSFGLMVVLFALGVMSVVWMAAIAGVIFAEKVLPYGVGLSRVVAPALILLGIWVAVSPGSAPGLTEPDRPSPMHME
jgi:predicted metal-binding membrane protein